MKNKEKFAKEIIDFGIKNKAIAVDKYTHNVVPCEGFECCDCLLDSGGYCDDNRSKWAEEEYVELPIDWSKVPVDTPILVRDSGDDKWGVKDTLQNVKMIKFMHGVMVVHHGVLMTKIM